MINLMKLAYFINISLMVINLLYRNQLGVIINCVTLMILLTIPLEEK